MSCHELPYLEVHLTDHCNLNCNGCTHYSPMAPPTFAELRQFGADMKQLSRLFRNIRWLRLMGGEPLLHPDPASFVSVTRACFPRAGIQFVTNGILLSKASADFWASCRSTSTAISISVYPPYRGRVEAWRGLCDREGVELYLTDGRRFFLRMNRQGDSDVTKAFRSCRSRQYCPFLCNGRIHTCAMSALVHYFNAEFGTAIESHPGIDLYEYGMSGRKILEFLDTPISTCRWCPYDWVEVPWSWGRRSDEWILGWLSPEGEASNTTRVLETARWNDCPELS
jgi:hypothetical protein